MASKSSRSSTYSKNAAKVEASHITKYRMLALLMPQPRSPKQSLLAQLPARQHAADEAADAITGAAAAATTAAIVSSLKASSANSIHIWIN